MQLEIYPKSHLIQLDREPNPALTGVSPDTAPERDLFVRALVFRNRSADAVTVEGLSWGVGLGSEPLIRRRYVGPGLTERLAQSGLARAGLLPPLRDFVFGGQPPSDKRLTDGPRVPAGDALCVLFEHLRVRSAEPVTRLSVELTVRDRGGPLACRVDHPVKRYRPRTPLCFPLRAPAYVFTSYGDLDVPSHRQLQSQEFALDLVGLPEGGKGSPRGTPNAECAGYGEAVVAVAAGEVVAAHDGYPENPARGELLAPPEAARLAAEHGVLPALVGNHVVVAHPGGEHSLYVHLIPGSVAVTVGDAVETGQRLGRLGNSGLSGGPHLHFALMDGPDVVRAQGLPCRFEGLRHLLWDQAVSGVPETGWVVGG